VLEDGSVVAGVDAFKPDVRSKGRLESSFQASESSQLVDRYKFNKPVLEAVLRKVIADLKVTDPSSFRVMLSIPQSIPSVFITELLNTLIKGLRFKAASVARHPSLILDDVTTGVVVDIGERLNIVPVIDEYIVENAIISLPFGAQQIRDSLQKRLGERNNGVCAFNSAVE
jgi:actin-related protein